MNKKIISILSIIEILLIMSSNIISYANSVEDEEVAYFGNPHLKQLLVDEYDKNKDGELSLTEMKEIKELSFGSSQYITDFTGLEYATNLEYFSYVHKSYSYTDTTYPTININSLTKLHNLKTLYLEHAEISNIEDLYNITSLTNLKLSRMEKNKITMKGLSNLENLVKLYIFFTDNTINDTGDTDSFINFKKIEEIELLNVTNNINGVACLQNLKRLTAVGKNITDISSVSNLTNLQYLDLRSNKIENISPIENLTNLENLDLGTNNISDLRPLKNLTNLQILDLWNNKITDISDLSNLTNLESLDLGCNKIENIEQIENLQNTCEINANGQEISLEIGYIPKGIESEYDLPLIVSQIFNNKEVFKKIYKMKLKNGGNSYVNEDKTKIMLDSSSSGYKEITLNIVDTSGTSILRLYISYDVMHDKGDINGDDKINIKDWNRLYKYINGTMEFTEEQLACADINNDGKVNIKDWNRLYKYLNGTSKLE